MSGQKELRLRYVADIGDMQRKLGEIDRAHAGIGKTLQRTGQSMQSAGRQLTMGLTLPIVALGGLAIKSAIDFESGFAGVRKTVDATEAQLAALSRGIRDMAKEIPASTEELSKIAEMAGQLGIKQENILGFTRVIADMGETTNLSGDQAASAFARIANIMGTAQTKFSNMGSTIVALGNAGASTESEITEFALRIAGAGKIAGLTEPQVLGIGEAMSSVGIQAEAGGTAVQKALLTITESVATGDDKLAKFADVAGMSSAKFAKAWKEDAGAAFVQFVQGLGDKGTDAIGLFKDLGLNSERVKRAFLSLGGAGDLLADSMTLGNEAWAENNALTEEAAKRYATTESKLKILRNKFKDVQITLGEALIPVLMSAAPAIEKFASFVEKIAQAFASLPGPVQTGIVAVLGVAALLGPVTFAIGMIVSTIGTLATAFKVVSVALMANPIVLIIAGIALAIGLAVFLIVKHWDTIKAATLDVWNTITSGLSTAWNFIKDTAVTIWDAIVGFFRRWGVWILAALTGPIGLLVVFLAKNWDAIKQKASDVWNAVLGFIGKVWNGITSRVRTAVKSVVDFVRTQFNKVKGIVVDAWNAGLSWLKGLPGRIVSAVGDLGRVLYNAGRAVLTGLWDGIASMFGWLKDKVGGIASSVASWKGPIPVDLKLLVPAGDAIMRGLGAGLESGVHKHVEPVLRDLTRQLPRHLLSIPGVETVDFRGSDRFSSPTRSAVTAESPLARELRATNNELRALRADVNRLLEKDRHTHVSIDGREVLTAVERQVHYKERAHA